ncbi:hypothetical protein AB0F73_24345 [Micromonospora purpureochromogenes]|uniref:hypothetical protein n=1 Tax=Micromonospora purpureochromogenes TaxID=47872 RepID=UPI0033C7EF6B
MDVRLGEVAVAPRYLTPNAVFVQTRTSGGSAADRPFHLVVANSAPPATAPALTWGSAPSGVERAVVAR